MKIVIETPTKPLTIIIACVNISKLIFKGGAGTMLKAKDVAEYFLFKSEPEEEDYISNLKLQKLLYYAQGFNLAINGEPLFMEPIEAWTHGPVVKALYHEYKDYGAQNINRPEKIDLDEYDEEAKALLDEVWEVYGQYSASKLRKLSHEESPWREAYARCPGAVITQDKMKEFFKSLLVDE